MLVTIEILEPHHESATNSLQSKHACQPTRDENETNKLDGLGDHTQVGRGICTCKIVLSYFELGANYSPIQGEQDENIKQNNQQSRAWPDCVDVRPAMAMVVRSCSINASIDLGVND